MRVSVSFLGGCCSASIWLSLSVFFLVKNSLMSSILPFLCFTNTCCLFVVVVSKPIGFDVVFVLLVSLFCCSLSLFVVLAAVVVILFVCHRG